LLKTVKENKAKIASKNTHKTTKIKPLTFSLYETTDNSIYATLLKYANK